MIMTIMNRTSKLLVVALAVAAATVTGLKAGSTSQGEESTKYSLTVENGKPSDNYEAGTLVSVVANAAPAGAEFRAGQGHRDFGKPIFTQDHRDNSLHGGDDHRNLHCTSSEIPSGTWPSVGGVVLQRTNQSRPSFARNHAPPRIRTVMEIGT